MNKRINCNTVFFSFASENQDIKQLIKEIQDNQEKHFFTYILPDDVNHKVVTNDTITKLYDEINECDLFIHVVGSNPGSQAKDLAITEFFRERKISDKEFLSMNRGRTIKPFFEELRAELTYAQWEVYLAIHLGKEILIFSPLPSNDVGFVCQEKHLSALKKGRFHLNGSANALSIDRAIQNYFKNKSPSLPEPIDSENYLEDKRKNFTGRKWIFDEIKYWLDDPNAPKVLLITGEPGMGKSAIVSELVHNNTEDQVFAYHCCRSDRPITLECSRFVQNIAALIATRHEKYAESLKNDWVLDENKICQNDPTSAFDQGILKVLQNQKEAPKNQNQPTSYILIDALDEAITLSGGESIVDVLANTQKDFPDWLRIVATTRREDTVLNQFKNHYTELRLADDPHKIEDLRKYIKLRLTKSISFQKELEQIASELIPSTTIEEFSRKIIETLTNRSKGNFLYVRILLDDLESSRNQQAFSLRRIDEWPHGLYAMYNKFFERRFGKDAENYVVAKQILEMICAARDPLEELLLETEVGSKVFKGLSMLKQFLSIDENPVKYASFHKSLTDWLMDDNTKRTSNFWIKSEKGDRKLAKFCIDKYTKFVQSNRKNDSPPNEYWVRHGCIHLLRTCDHLYNNKFKKVSASDKYRYLNTVVEILEWLNNYPAMQNIVANALPLLVRLLKKTESDLNSDDIVTRNTALKELEPMAEQKLFDLVKHTVATDITENVIRWIGKSQKKRWQQLVEKMLELNEYVIRYAASCGQAERYQRLRDDGEIDFAVAEISNYLNSPNINEIELGGYAVGEIAKEELVTGLESVTKQWLKKISDTDIYFCQSILGDVLLSLVLQSRHAQKIIKDLDESKCISVFWEPIWEYTRLDVIGVLSLLKAQGQLLEHRDISIFHVEVDNEIAMIRVREDRIARFEDKVGDKWKNLTEILHKATFENNDIEAIREWLTRKEESTDQQVNMAVEFLKLIFTHPLWQICEKGAAILPLLASELDWRVSCFKILDQLLDSLDTLENNSGIANWRAILGVTETCFLIRHLDQRDYKDGGITRVEHCWNEYYNHTNCHVRGLIIEGFFGIAGVTEAAKNDWERNHTISYLENHTQKIDHWLLDDEIWVLEHVYQAFRLIDKKQADENKPQYDILGYWFKERLKHVEENPDCLLDRVSKQTGKSWEELERDDFLRQIQAIKRSQLVQQRISH